MKSHIQPQLFLKGFKAAPKGEFHSDSIYVYKKGQPYKTDGSQSENNPSYQGIKNVGYVNNFYGFVKGDGTFDEETYEIKLQQEFEAPCDRILKKLRDIEIKKNDTVPLDEILSGDERRKFARYTGSMYARSESSREHFSRILHTVSESYSMTYDEMTIKATEEDKAKLDAYIKKIKPDFNRSIDRLSPPPRLLKEFQDEKEIDDSYPSGIFHATDLAAPYIERMKWHFIKSRNRHAFFTGDVPVIWSRLNSPNAELFFPISSDMIFFCSPETPVKEVLRCNDNSKFVEAVRDRFARQCSKIFYSIETQWLVKFLNNR